MPRCYVSPSLQTWNIGFGDYGTEAARMSAIADVICRGLSRCKVESKRSNLSMTLQQAIYDSNAYLGGIPNEQRMHVAPHSNSGGGVGTEEWVYATGANAERAANCIYKYLAPLTPDPDRGIKVNANFMELNSTDAPAVIIETDFHDNAVGAVFIAAHPVEIGEAMVHGICDYFGVPYIEEGKTLENAILVYGPDDTVTARRLAESMGNCAIFFRKADGSASPDVKVAKTLYIVGGGSVGHPNERILSGPNYFRTTDAVGKALGQ